jgi:hypothetical protein
VTALTGVAGGLSGMLFPLLTGWLVDHFSYLLVSTPVAVRPLPGAAALFGVGHRRGVGRPPGIKPRTC